MFDIVFICIWTGGDDDTTEPRIQFQMGRLLPLILSVCPYVCQILSLGFSHLIITPGFISPGFISPGYHFWFYLTWFYLTWLPLLVLSHLVIT
jgi:hypothetical protein